MMQIIGHEPHGGRSRAAASSGLRAFSTMHAPNPQKGCQRGQKNIKSTTIHSKYGELMVDISNAYPYTTIEPMHLISTVISYQSTGTSGVYPVARSAVNLSTDFCTYNIRSSAQYKLQQWVTTVLISLRGFLESCKPDRGGQNCPRASVTLFSPICGPSS